MKKMIVAVICMMSSVASAYVYKVNFGAGFGPETEVFESPIRIAGELIDLELDKLNCISVIRPPKNSQDEPYKVLNVPVASEKCPGERAL